MKNSILFRTSVFPQINDWRIQLCNKVPGSIKRKLPLQYPLAEEISWVKDKQTKCYTAQFKEGALKQQVSFNKNGDWIERKCFLEKEQLDARIQRILMRIFGEYKVVSAFRYEKTDHLDPEYYVVLHGNRNGICLMFNKHGVLLEETDV